MAICVTTVKGQIVIPAALRKKYGIKKGTRVAVSDGGGVILVKPLLDDPVHQARGILKGEGSALRALKEDRKQEAER